MKSKIWCVMVILALISSLACFSLLTIIIDPYFHYHAPLDNFFYRIYNERYQNYGIIRNFDYDMIITGTSMTECFKTSECDKLRGGGKTVKIPFSGATYKEIDMCVRKAAKVNDNLKYILRAIDYGRRVWDKDIMRDDDKYPDYLYNSSIFDDVKYFLNKEVFFEDTLNVLSTYDNSIKGKSYTDFDDYANWGIFDDAEAYGKDAVLAGYQRNDMSDIELVLSDTDKIVLLENLRQNVTEIAEENPDITFYYFFPPFSICWWDDDIYRKGKLKWELETEKITIQELLKYDNIKLYSFSDNLELITNLDNYKDKIHYSKEINSMILQCVFSGEYELTEKNYEAYLERLEKNLYNYDFDSIYE